MAQNLADVRLSDQAPAAPASGSSTPTNPFSVNTKKPSAPEADGAVASTSSATQTSVAAQKEPESQESEKRGVSQGAQVPQQESPVPASAGAVTNASGFSPPQSGRSSRSSSEEADAEGWTVVDAHCKFLVLHIDVMVFAGIVTCCDMCLPCFSERCQC